MSHRYRIFRNVARGGRFYMEDAVTGKQESLRTKQKSEAERLVNVRNEAARIPAINLQIARCYVSMADPKMTQRTWQEVMDIMVANKHGATQERWVVAVKSTAFDPIRRRPLLETTSEELLRILQGCKVSTNVYLRRLHNFSLDMDWLLKGIIPRKQWPAIHYRNKRGITFDEHQQIIAREGNPERRAFYELCWHLGGSQSDVAMLTSKNIDWENRTVIYQRKKLAHTNAVPARIRFGDHVATVLALLPKKGPLFPYLCTVRANDRASEFRQRVMGLKIKDVSLHCYRYAWAERARSAGYPERFAMEALGHGSKAVTRAYAAGASVNIPTLELWQEQNENRNHIRAYANVTPVDFKQRNPDEALG